MFSKFYKLLPSNKSLPNYIVKRPYWTPNPNSNNFIDYEKYVSQKKIDDIHVNFEQKKELFEIQCNLSTLNQSMNDQKYWLFHSVFLSYIGMFAYIFKL